jgi:hypothetical protein
MTLPFTANVHSSPFAALIVGLVCAQAACSLQALDYLQNGAKRDGGSAGDQSTSNQDTSGPKDTPRDAIESDGTVFDTTAIETALSPDSSGLDGSDVPSDVPVLDGQAESPGAPDTAPLNPDAKNPDSALLDTKNPDGAVHDALLNLDVRRLDGPSPDSSISDTRPDLGIAGPDSPIDQAPDVAGDLAVDTTPTTNLPDMYYRAGTIYVGTTYENASVNLGSQPNTLILVTLAWDDSAIPEPTITYAGSAMTLAESDIVNGQSMAIYYLVRPPTGVGTLSVTFTSSVHLTVGILGLRNVNSSIPVMVNGMTSANWSELSYGAFMAFDGSLALVFNISTTGNNDLPTVSDGPYSLYQVIPGRPTSPYLSVGAGYCSTSCLWTFTYEAPHWQGISVVEIRGIP